MRDPVCVPPLTETVLIPGTSLLCPGQNDSLSEGRTRRGGRERAKATELDLNALMRPADACFQL